MQKDACGRCERADQSDHHKDLTRGLLMFFLGTITLAAILGLSVVWHYRPDLLWPHGLQSLARNPQASKYAQWFLAASIGTLVYLLRNIAHYRTRKHHYRLYTQWFLAALITGPIVALVVMWTLTNLTIVLTQSEIAPPTTIQTTTTETTGTVKGSIYTSSTTTTVVVGSQVATSAVATAGSVETSPAVAGGVVLDINNLALEAQLALAFILGYFGRTTTKQLEITARKLLPEAWNRAEVAELMVEPPSVRVASGGSVAFRTNKRVEAIWSTTAGEVGAETGVFVAPRLDKQDFKSNGPILAIVKAQPKGATFIVSSAEVEVVPFEVHGDSCVEAGTSVLYSTTPSVNDVQWTVSPPAAIAGDGLLTTRGSDAGKTVVVTASSPSWAHSSSMVVGIVKPQG